MASDCEPRCVADVKAVLGEGPVWVDSEQAVYWVDIKGRRIFRLDSDGGQSEWHTPFRVGSLAPRRGGGFIGGTELGFAEMDPEANRFEVFANPEGDRPNNRFNDGKTDWRGWFWAGTMHEGEQEASGALYRLDDERRITCIDDGYLVTNGPAFDHAATRMYHTDSARQVIYIFDISPEGDVGERRVFARFGEGEGHPDGMTVDSDGCLWVCFWDGWCLRQLSPDGKVMRTLDMPVQRPTSCTFGGPDLDRLYVTSATTGLTKEALAKQSCAGGLFLVETGARGVAQVPYAG